MSWLTNAHALVVGVHAYQDLPSLSTAVLNDMRGIYQTLVDPSLCAYPPENVHQLFDAQATRDAILGELDALAKHADENSTVLFYYSGHGGEILQGPQTGKYLLPVNASWLPDYQGFKDAITGDEFMRALNVIRARKLIVILDCCHAGGIAQFKGAPVPFHIGFEENYYAMLERGSGRVILTSSLEGEKSWFSQDVPNSVFTRHVLNGLRGGAARDDAYIRILDLYSYLQPRVVAEEPRQHPLLYAQAQENFAIALARGGAQEPSPSDAQGFRYDAYLCFADAEPDRTRIEQQVIPRLRDAGLRLAVRYQVEEAGAFQVVDVQNIVEQAKYTVIFLSPAYFADPIAEFTDVLSQTMNLAERTFRLKPVFIDSMGNQKIPSRLAVYVTLDLTRPERFEREMNRLTETLRKPTSLK